MLTTVIARGERFELAVEQRSKAAWIMSGTYRGKLLQWKGRSANIATASWRDHARISSLRSFSCNRAASGGVAGRQPDRPEGKERVALRNVWARVKRNASVADDNQRVGEYLSQWAEDREYSPVIELSGIPDKVSAHLAKAGVAICKAAQAEAAMVLERERLRMAGAVETERGLRNEALGEVTLVADGSPAYTDTFLHLEAAPRKSAPTGAAIQVAGNAAIDDLDFQLDPVRLALGAPRARILIGDDVGLGKSQGEGWRAAAIMG